MWTKKENDTESWAAILIGVFALIALKAIFENDESNIISKKGNRYLLDEDKMDEISDQIDKSESQNQHKEIII